MVTWGNFPGVDFLTLDNFGQPGVDFLTFVNFAEAVTVVGRAGGAENFRQNNREGANFGRVQFRSDKNCLKRVPLHLTVLIRRQLRLWEGPEGRQARVVGKIPTHETGRSRLSDVR